MSVIYEAHRSDVKKRFGSEDTNTEEDILQDIRTHQIIGARVAGINSVRQSFRLLVFGQTSSIATKQ